MKRFCLFLILSIVLTSPVKADSVTWPCVSYVYCNETGAIVHQTVQTDSTTEITLTLEGKPGTRLSISRHCHLVDEADNRYLILRSRNLTLGKSEMVDETGKKTFTLIFPVLPAKTHSFDLIEDAFLGALRIYGIHDAKQPLALPDLWNGPCKRLPEVDLFKLGDATLTGQVVKPYGTYSPVVHLFAPSILNPYHEATALIGADGRLNLKTTIESPQMVRMASGADYPLYASYVFLRPGKKTEISVTDTASTGTVVSYSNNESYARLLQHIPYWLYHEDGARLREASFEKCDTLLQLYERRNRSLANYLARKYGLNEHECTLLRTWVEMTSLLSRLNVAGDMTNQRFRRIVGNDEFIYLPQTVAHVYDRVYDFLAEAPLDNPNYALINMGMLAAGDIGNIMPVSRAMRRVFEQCDGMKVTEHFYMERLLQICKVKDSVLRSVCHYDHTPVMVQAAIAKYFIEQGGDLTQDERRMAVEALSGIISDKALRKRMHFFAESGYKVSTYAGRQPVVPDEQTRALVQRLFPDAAGKVVHIVGFGTGQGSLLGRIDNLLYDFKGSPDFLLCFVTREGAMSQMAYERMRTGVLADAAHCLRLSDEDYFRLMYAARGWDTFQLTLDGTGHQVSSLNVADEYDFRKGLRNLLCK